MLTLKSIPCLVCGSSDKKVLGQPKVVDDIFSKIPSVDASKVKIVACKECSLIYVDPFTFFSDELLSKMYSNDNHYFPDINPKLANIIHKKNPERRFKQAQKYAQKPIKKYLEIGCGEGYALKIAQQLGWQVEGQDISSDFAENIKKKTGIDIKVGVIDEASYEPESFDLIYIDSVLEHVPDPLGYMKALKTFLAPGGVIYLTIPNEDALPLSVIDFINQKMRGRKTTSRIMPFAEPYHITGFSKKSIEFLAKKLDLNIAHLIRSHSYYHVPRENQSLPFGQKVKRHLFGAFHLFSDTINQGMNMEVVFVK